MALAHQEHTVNIIPSGEAAHRQSMADVRSKQQDQARAAEEQARHIPVPPPDRDLQERVARAREAAAQPSQRNWLLAFVRSRRLLAILVLAALVYAALAIPHFFWVQAPELPLKIAVVDKTVPFKDRREHKSFFWLLLQNKFVDPAQSGEERWYDYEKDYIGFDPVDAPEILAASFITPRALADRDVLYIADTYGVYAADYTQFEGDVAHTIHSPEMFGGLTKDEVAALEEFVKQGKTIIAEFNTCASPTKLPERELMENVLGIKWTGWVGRYFVDFRDREDVPDWLYQLYEKKYNKKWDLTGSGYMLCRNEEQEFIILRDGKDVNSAGLEFVPLRVYAENDVMQGVKPATFNFWFDIVQPAKDTDVLAQYQFNLTESGHNKLAEHGLDPVFAAICRHSHNYKAYYIAGEMLDFSRSLGPPDTRLAIYVNRSFFGKAQASNESFFYWHTAYPLMTNILRSESNRINGEPEKVFLWK